MLGESSLKWGRNPLKGGLFKRSPTVTCPHDQPRHRSATHFLMAANDIRILLRLWKAIVNTDLSLLRNGCRLLRVRKRPQFTPESCLTSQVSPNGSPQISKIGPASILRRFSHRLSKNLQIYRRSLVSFHRLPLPPAVSITAIPIALQCRFLWPHRWHALIALPILLQGNVSIRIPRSGQSRKRLIGCVRKALKRPCAKSSSSRKLQVMLCSTSMRPVSKQRLASFRTASVFVSRAPSKICVAWQTSDSPRQRN